MRIEPIRSVKGTRDLLPPDTALWQRVEAEAHRVFAAYHYGEIRTPMLEETALFARSVGDRYGHRHEGDVYLSGP